MVEWVHGPLRLLGCQWTFWVPIETPMGGPLGQWAPQFDFGKEVKGLFAGPIGTQKPKNLGEPIVGMGLPLGTLCVG